MINFASDYIAGAHPEVLKRLNETNLENLSGYGTDEYCESATQRIRAACGRDNIDVYYLVGGTQTNQIITGCMLKPYEGVIAASTGHVSLHEAGAIEYTGHKVIELPATDGKITAEAVSGRVDKFYADENHEHMTFPGMVYISYPTEYGTLYSEAELMALYKVCRDRNMVLYIDGARLGYALASSECDITLSRLCELCDVFYIGGTKVGALCGEAVVFTHNNMPAHFNTMVKQRGAMIAKGRLLGVQFDALFTDDLYMRIGRHGIKQAERLKQIFIDKGYRFFIDSPTNQQFIILDNEVMDRLSGDVTFSFWEKYDEKNTVVRFATSWSTTDEDIDKLEKIL